MCLFNSAESVRLVLVLYMFFVKLFEDVYAFVVEHEILKASSSENGTPLKEVDSIVVAVGNDEDILYSKSTALHVSMSYLG